MHSSRMRTGPSLTVCWHVLPRGALPGPGGGSLVPGGGLWSRGVCLVPVGWVSGPGGGGLASQYALRQTPPPHVNRITDACKNITLAQLRCGR